jgi:hypothetical protein
MHSAYHMHFLACPHSLLLILYNGSLDPLCMIDRGQYTRPCQKERQYKHYFPLL